MNISTFKPPTAWIPIAMSLAALCTVLARLALFWTAPQSDEGAAAHIFQLLIAGEVPILIFYAVKSLPRSPKASMQVIGVQILAVVAALAPIYLLGW